ncbi:NBR1-Ig-like domain-containing protein [Aquabacterium sp.]|uniref:NBR1-Ig-like domain-containing protein n=1 Tax=Aquabacterium sp. TaxID=1872578 RepID=UPI0024896CBC|nr:NBR1-Ig-like domain-containing protein [Aquabacterium sp.]MDI1259525.1 NBR1-Ig-like domain-containing protein [Aquabacterium sp.]
MSADALRALLRQRARDLGKTFKALAIDAGLARTYLYKLADGVTLDPSVGTLVRLADALEVSPIALLRHYVHLDMPEQRAKRPGVNTSRSQGLSVLDDAVVFNADITIPDHAVVRGGEAFRKVWEIQNVGRVAWLARRLVRADQQYVISRAKTDGALEPLVQAHLRSVNLEVQIPDTLPGECVRVEVDFAAPRENCSVASIWRIHDKDGRPCYDASFFLQVIVTVIDQ